jgi:hypothetical protein
MAFDKYVDIITSAVDRAKAQEDNSMLGGYCVKMARTLEKMAYKIRRDLMDKERTLVTPNRRPDPRHTSVRSQLVTLHIRTDVARIRDDPAM